MYGTASSGGDLVACYKGCGTVFEVRADGREKTLYTFRNGSDGSTPAAGLIFDDVGNLFGTTIAGGGATLCGTVFRLSPDGVETVSYRFVRDDGCNPAANLILDSNGNLYGTTAHGGNERNAACGSYYPYGCGVVFRLSSTGTFKRLHAFNGRDGDQPEGGVIRDAQGNLYGTTTIAGTADAGTLYKHPAHGRLAILHMFTGGADGAFPSGDLVMDENGNLYGTVGGGGDSGCLCGAVFEYSP